MPRAGVRSVEFTNGSGEDVLLIRQRKGGRPGWWDIDRRKWFPDVSGGAGLTLNWKGTTATWATASNWIDQATGVAALASPTNADICRFGVGTGATNNACTTSAGDVCGEFSADDSYTGTLTLANATTALAVGGAALGAFRLGTGMTLTNAGANTRLTLVATSDNGGAGFNVTTNGKVLSQFRVAGVGGSWVLQDAITTNVNSSTAFVVASGALTTNGKTVTIQQAGGALAVNGGTLTTGASTFNFSATNAVTFWSYSSGTVNGTGSTIILTAASANTRTFAGGGQTYGTLTYTVAGSTGQLSITGSNTFSAINFSDATNGRTLSLANGTTTTCPNWSGVFGRSGANVTLTGGTGATIATTGGATMAFVTADHITATPSGAVYVLDGVDGGNNTGIVFSPPNQIPQQQDGERRRVVAAGSGSAAARSRSW